MNYINTWGCAHLGEDVVAEDLPLYNLGAAVKCISENDKILTCLYKDRRVRIFKSGWETRKSPDFVWNDKVRIKAKNTTAIIDSICWHLNDQRYFYYLVKEDGKKLSKRYFADELEKVE